jgi:O-antigen/teichoic acid export membrane protein
MSISHINRQVKQSLRVLVLYTRGCCIFLAWPTPEYVILVYP